MPHADSMITFVSQCTGRTALTKTLQTLRCCPPNCLAPTQPCGVSPFTSPVASKTHTDYQAFILANAASFRNILSLTLIRNGKLVHQCTPNSRASSALLNLPQNTFQICKCSSTKMVCITVSISEKPTCATHIWRGLNFASKRGAKP